MFILLLCLAHMAHSEISVQTESANQITENDLPAHFNNHEKVMTTEQFHTKQQRNSTSVDSDVNNMDLSVSPKHEIQIDKNSEVKLSFNENTTALIRELKATVEKLIAHLEAIKSKSKVLTSRRSLQGSIYDIFPTLLRKKRSVENMTDDVTDSNVIPISIKMVQSDVENVTKAAETENVTKENGNEIDTYYDWLNNDTSAENKTETPNGRRSFNSDLEIAKVVHARLLSYVHEHISDTMNKIDSLRSIKNSYSTNNMFNMGYILANVDLIEVNLMKLKSGIDENKRQWTEAHILDVFDKVKYTNTVVTSLITALRSILNAASGNVLNENIQRVYGK